MEQILERIDSCCRKLPVGTAVSSTNNPKPMERMLRHIQRGMSLCQVCLRVYSTDQMPEQLWLDERSQRASAPWAEHTPADWHDMSKRLLLLMVDYWPELSQVYVDYSPQAVDRQRPYRASELLYVLRLMMDLCRYGRMDDAAQRRQHARLPQDWAVVSEQELRVAEVPVYQMKCSELMESMRHLIKKSVTLPFHPQVVEYFHALEHALARQVNYAQSVEVLDVPDYCQPVPNVAGLALANGKLVGIASIMCVLLYRRFSLATNMVPRAPAMDLGAGLAQRVKDWYISKAKGMTSRSGSKKLRDRVLRCWLSAGEVELYRYEYPKEEDDTLAILARNRGASFQTMLGDTDMAPADVIEQQLAPLDPAHISGQENFVLQMSMLELCEHTFQHNCYGGDWFNFVVLEQDLEDAVQYLQRSPMPHLVQMYNHWQLCYKDTMYIYDSYLLALTAWFVVMYRDMRGQFNPDPSKPTRADLHLWAEEVFGAAVLPYQPAALRPLTTSALGRFVF
jgi:hypothetical protein